MWFLIVLSIFLGGCSKIKLPDQRVIYEPPPPRTNNPREICPLKASATEVEARQKYILDTYQIDAKMDKASHEDTLATYSAMDEAHFAAATFYLKVLEMELAKYPPRLIEHARIRFIRFVTSLRSGSGMEAGGIALSSEGTVLISVVTWSCNSAFLKELYAHEFFHMIQRNSDPFIIYEEEWMKLNPPWFSYTNNGSNLSSELTHPRSGFVSEYSMTNVLEDTAEIFSAMMVSLPAKRLREWTQTDSYLANKVAEIQSKLLYVSDAFTQKYWDSIVNGTLEHWSGGQ